MAQTTTALLEAALVTALGNDAGSKNPIAILKEDHDAATTSRWYVVGSPSAAENNHRAMWVKTTVSGDADAQAAEVIAAMTSVAGATDGNADPDIGP